MRKDALLFPAAVVAAVAVQLILVPNSGAG
jgi:hypothetical protein